MESNDAHQAVLLEGTDAPMADAASLEQLLRQQQEEAQAEMEGLDR